MHYFENYFLIHDIDILHRFIEYYEKLFRVTILKALLHTPITLIWV